MWGQTQPLSHARLLNHFETYPTLGLDGASIMSNVNFHIKQALARQIISMKIPPQKEKGILHMLLKSEIMRKRLPHAGP